MIRHGYLDKIKDYGRNLLHDADRSCSICFEDYKDDDEIVTLNCATNHIYHY